MAAKWLFLFVLEGNMSKTRRIRSSVRKKKVPRAFPVCWWRAFQILYHFIPIQGGEGLQGPPSAEKKLRLGQGWGGAQMAQSPVRHSEYFTGETVPLSNIIDTALSPAGQARGPVGMSQTHDTQATARGGQAGEGPSTGRQVFTSS